MRGVQTPFAFQNLNLETATLKVAQCGLFSRNVKSCSMIQQALEIHLF